MTGPWVIVLLWTPTYESGCVVQVASAEAACTMLLALARKFMDEPRFEAMAYPAGVTR